jgi:hypothetical protein
LRVLFARSVAAHLRLPGYKFHCERVAENKSWRRYESRVI